jgi:hypothetical protein
MEYESVYLTARNRDLASAPEFIFLCEPLEDTRR